MESIFHIADLCPLCHASQIQNARIFVLKKFCIENRDNCRSQEATNYRWPIKDVGWRYIRKSTVSLARKG